MENASPIAADAALPPPRVQLAAVSSRPAVARMLYAAKELVTVFLGVYAAFVLNNYQLHRQERQRREQILEWAQAEYSETLANVSREEAVLREGNKIFHRKVEAGEMPALHVFNFITDYNPTDFTTVLQSGGFELLDIRTVRAIREVEGSLRQMIGIVQHDQRLSDEMILPKLGQPPDIFYDPASKQLRPDYAWYPEYFETQLRIFVELKTELDKALAQIRTEREHNR